MNEPVKLTYGQLESMFPGMTRCHMSNNVLSVVSPFQIIELHNVVLFDTEIIKRIGHHHIGRCVMAKIGLVGTIHDVATSGFVIRWLHNGSNTQYITHEETKNFSFRWHNEQD